MEVVRRGEDGGREEWREEGEGDRFFLFFFRCLHVIYTFVVFRKYKFEQYAEANNMNNCHQ